MVAGPPSLTVVPVSDDRIDDAALQFLLQQSLLASAEEEEEKAREEAEVKELEEKVAKRMQRVAEKIEKVARRDQYHLSTNLPDLERTARPLRGAQGEEEEEEEEKQVPGWVPGQLLFMTPHRFSLPWFACRCLGVA